MVQNALNDILLQYMYCIPLICLKSTVCSQLTTFQPQFNASEQCNSKGNREMRKKHSRTSFSSSLRKERACKVSRRSFFDNVHEARSWNYSPFLFKLRKGSKAQVQVVGKAVYRGGGYGMEILCVYKFTGQP